MFGRGVEVIFILSFEVVALINSLMVGMFKVYLMEWLLT